QSRPQHVVHTSDDERTEHGEADASPDLACRDEDERGRVGTQTSALPTPGMIDKTVITVPQKIAPSRPTAQNASPPSTPWAAPIRTVPFKVARVTETNLSSIRCLSASVSGR